MSVGSKTAVGKITEGSALKGDSVVASGSRSSKKSSSNDNEEEDSPKTSRGKKIKRSKGGGFGLHVGMTYAMLSNITSVQGDYTQDGQAGLFLMGEYRTGKSLYHFGLRYASGGAEFTSKQSGLVITDAKVNTTNLFARISSPISRSLYATYGAQISMVSLEDHMVTTGASGAHTLDLKGLGGIGGFGYDIMLGSFVVKAESLLEINYYFMNSSKVPGSAGEFDTGAFMTYGLHLNLSVGYKF